MDDDNRYKTTTIMRTTWKWLQQKIDDDSNILTVMATLTIESMPSSSIDKKMKGGKKEDEQIRNIFINVCAVIRYILEWMFMFFL